MKTKYQRDLALLQRKHADRCSICYTRFGDDEAVYTVTGYDKRQKLQVSSECCANQIVDVRLIGVCGYFDEAEFDAILADHPLYDSFMIKKNQ